MDLHFFFEGAVSRELAASALLATLLEGDVEFASRFLDLVAPDLERGAAGPWSVSTEDKRPGQGGMIDVLLESPSTIVVIENKTSASTKRPMQLLQYYIGAVSQWPGHRIISIYLAPRAEIGLSEVELVLEEAKLRGRSGPDGDIARPIGWDEVEPLLAHATGPDAALARSGMAALRKALDDDARRVYIEWSVNGFLEAAAKESLPGPLVIAGLHDWMQRANRTIEFGNGATGPLYVTLADGRGRTHRVGHVGTNGWVKVSYKDLKGARPYDEPPYLDELLARLNAIPGIAIKDGYYAVSGASWLKPSVMAQPSALQAYCDAMTWVEGEILAAARR